MEKLLAKLLGIKNSYFFFLFNKFNLNGVFLNLDEMVDDS